MRARRHQSIRSRLTALLIVPLVSLVALWVLAVALTSGDVVTYIGGQTAQDQYGTPAMKFIVALEQERRASLVYVGSGRESSQQAAMVSARNQTDQVMNQFRSQTGGQGGFLVSSQITDAANVVLQDFPRVGSLRTTVDAAIADRLTVLGTFTELIDENVAILDQIAAASDVGTLVTAKNLVDLVRARELLSREDALVAGAQAAGKFTSSEFSLFAGLAGSHQTVYDDVVGQLDKTDQAGYQQVTQSADYQALTQAENLIISTGGPNQPIPVTESRWQGITGKVLASLDSWDAGVTAAANGRTAGATVRAFVLLGLAGLLGLVAVVASLVFSVRVSRRLIKQLRRLGGSAQDMATKQLPAVVERLRQGDKVDADIEAPALEYGSDEIGQVGDSFNAVRHTAVLVAVEQANLRSGINTVFVNIARRTQGLVHQQLSQLDAMERKATDPADLDDLFRIDNLATRMRRNAENLIILGGGAPGRQWRQPVPLVDVIRSAAAEVGGYSRVRVLPIGDGALNGAAVSDVTHLLSELIDNAVSFSPPHTQVQVTGQLVPKGFVVEIEDRGLGMQTDEMTAANRYFANPPEFNVLAISDNSRLGMFVVARLAARHNVHVSLRSSPYGGTCAIVLLPSNLVSTGNAVDRAPAEPKALVGATTGGGHGGPAPVPQLSELEAGPSSGGGGGQDRQESNGSRNGAPNGFTLAAAPDPYAQGPSDDRVTGGTIDDGGFGAPSGPPEDLYDQSDPDERVTGGTIDSAYDEASEYEDTYASSAAEAAAERAPSGPQAVPDLPHDEPEPAYGVPTDQRNGYSNPSVERAEFIPFVRPDDTSDDLLERRSGGAHRMPHGSAPPAQTTQQIPNLVPLPTAGHQPPPSGPPSNPFDSPPGPFGGPPSGPPGGGLPSRPVSAPASDPTSGPPNGQQPVAGLPSYARSTPEPPQQPPYAGRPAGLPSRPVSSPAGPSSAPVSDPAGPARPVSAPAGPVGPIGGPPGPSGPVRPVSAPAGQPAHPPMAQPPMAQPPVAQPPVASPSFAPPPVGQPPVAQPLVAQPPVAQPPASAPASAPGPMQQPGPTQQPGPMQPGPVRAAGPPPATAQARTLPPLPPVSAPGPASRAEHSGPQLGDHRGLPRRIRQASLSPQLAEVVPPPQEPDGPPVEHRSADDARRLMAAYQSGSWRGRSAPADWSAQSPLGSPTGFPPGQSTRDDAAQQNYPSGDRGADG
jgi:signal transduction histidine kinase